MEIRKYHWPTNGHLTWVGAGDACASKNKRIHSNTFSGSLSGMSMSMQMACPIGGFGKVKSGNMSSWRPTHAHAPRLLFETLFLKTCLFQFCSHFTQGRWCHGDLRMPLIHVSFFVIFYWIQIVSWRPTQARATRPGSEADVKVEQYAGPSMGGSYLSQSCIWVGFNSGTVKLLL